MRDPFRIFVTATDTGVGKTEASCALLSLLADRGAAPAPFKPYESGCEDLDAPGDATRLIAAASSSDPIDRVCPHRFRAPLAPGVAARRLGADPSFRTTLAAYRSFRGRAIVAEGAGGLRVPIDRKRDVVDLIAALRLPVLLVARAALGTLNHTALSIDLLERRNIPVAGVLLVRHARARDPSERDNGALIAERHRVRVLGPVAFEPDARRRRAAFRRVLRALLPDS
jgi:dethiobiotin synthetase